jgi:hypothetical protein
MATPATPGSSGSKTDHTAVEPASNMYSTIGSQIHCLSLDCNDASFFRVLSRNAHRIVHLHELQLYSLSHEACKQFARCLPKLTSIRRLSLKDVETSGDVLRGLKRNSSVQHVTFDQNSMYDFDFDPKHVRLIQAICRRNKFLAAISSTEPAGCANQTRARNCPHRDGGSSKSSAVDAVDSMGKVELAICPSLLKVAKQTPEDCSAIVMRGLLMLNQRVGDNKRGSIRCLS